MIKSKEGSKLLGINLSRDRAETGVLQNMMTVSVDG